MTTLPLRIPAETQTPVPDQQTASSLPPLLYDTADMCVVLRTSKASLFRLLASSKVPKPLKLGGLKFRADEIRRWVDAGMPDRPTWEAMEAARLKRTN